MRNGPGERDEAKAKPADGMRPETRTKIARSIEIAPWRTKIARQKWLIKKSHDRHATRHTPWSRTARSSTWTEEDDEEAVIDCEGEPEARNANPGENDQVVMEEVQEVDDEGNPATMEDDDQVEVEVEEDGDGDGDGEEGGEEEYDQDSMNLMQQSKTLNGEQLGILDADRTMEFVETFKGATPPCSTPRLRNLSKWH